MAGQQEFGKDLCLIHEIVVKGRELGLGREWWKLLNDEPLLTEVAEFVSTKPIVSGPILKAKNGKELWEQVHFNYFYPNMERVLNSEDYFLDPQERETEKFSLFFIPFQKSESQIRERLSHWHLRPADMLDTFSFANALRDAWGKADTSEQRNKLIVSGDFRAHVLALNAFDTTSPGHVLGLGISESGNYYINLGSYRTNEKSGLWSWTPDSEPVLFLAVPL